MNSPDCAIRQTALCRAGSHGSQIMTGDELKTNHLGLKLALGLLYPSVQLSLEAPGLPLSTAERSTSRVKPNLDTWCVPAEFARCLQNSSLCVSRIKTGLLIYKTRALFKALPCPRVHGFGDVCVDLKVPHAGKWNQTQTGLASEFLLIREVLTDSGIVARARRALIDVLLAARAGESRPTITAIKENH